VSSDTKDEAERLARDYAKKFVIPLGIAQGMEMDEIAEHWLAGRRSRDEEVQDLHENVEGHRDAWLGASDMCARVVKERDALRARVGRLERALEVAANQLEGVSLAIRAHGQNIEPHFFIETYRLFAEKARKALAGKDGK